jgi:hypothetical protein
MTKGLSIHIGLNSVDPAHYAGWSGNLRACEADAHSMNAISAARGFQSTVFLTAQATSANVINALQQAARDLKSGDILLITYSGHGGQVPDRNGEEDDGRDETWALYDRQLVDDELYALWGLFQAGVRIFMLSDSCHSGTMTRAIAAIPGTDALYENSTAALSGDLVSSNEPSNFRVLPIEIQDATYMQNRDEYDQIQKDNPTGDKTPVNASVILISGCQDNQTSMDGVNNGLFTGTLLKVWNNDQFKGGYRTFCRRIVRLMPPIQTPNFFTVGAQNKTFEQQTPFAISSSPDAGGTKGAGASSAEKSASATGQSSKKKGATKSASKKR